MLAHLPGGIAFLTHDWKYYYNSLSKLKLINSLFTAMSIHYLYRDKTSVRRVVKLHGQTEARVTLV